MNKSPILPAAIGGASLPDHLFNMLIRQNKIAFEVNLAATRRADLNLSSKLLRLPSEVRQ